MELNKVTREEAEAHVVAGGGAFFRLDASGDTKTIWNPESPDEVESAQAQFDKLVGEKGYAAFRVDEDGEKGEKMRTFDAKAGKIILVPPMVGG